MVPSGADIIIQNRRISQSETSARTIHHVVNVISLQRHLDISQRMNHVVRSDVT